MIHQLNHEITNPFALNDFINAAVHDLTIDDTLTEGTMVNLATEFHSFPAGSLQAVTMPTVGPYITSGGADVLLPAAAADQAAPAYHDRRRRREEDAAAGGKVRPGVQPLPQPGAPPLAGGAARALRARGP